MQRIKWMLLGLIGIAFYVNGQKTILLDNYYNNEFKPNNGDSFHYIWEDKAPSGFSEFGLLFEQRNGVLKTLRSAPTEANLKEVSVYIIVDPDDAKETKSPNRMNAKDANVIANWVKKGGVLLLLANAVGYCELDSLNLLAEAFGMRFNKDLLHPERVTGEGLPRDFNSCASVNLPKHPLFTNVSKIFIKEVSTIQYKKPATPILVEKGSVLIAEARFGKGYVLAVGDPWFYNEYIDHYWLPTDFENQKAAKNLVELLITKVRK